MAKFFKSPGFLATIILLGGLAVLWVAIWLISLDPILFCFILLLGLCSVTCFFFLWGVWSAIYSAIDRKQRGVLDE